MSIELNKEEMQEAIELWVNHKPMKPVREELGGDFYYRCPWLTCNQVVKREWVACPFCAQRLNWDDGG